MKTTTLIKRINEKERIVELATVFAHEYATCEVKDISEIFKQFSKQLDIVLKIK